MALQDADLEQSLGLLHSQAKVWSHIFSFINSMTLKCVVQLQIPDIINRHGAPMLLSELVDALPINKNKTQFIYRLMRVLVHSGFFVKQSARGHDDEEKEEEEEGYWLTPASRLLLTEEPLSMRPFLLAFLDPMLMDPWQNMSKWFQSDDDVTPFETTYGKMIWDVASHEPVLGKYINEAMATDTRFTAIAILKQCAGVFEGVNSIVDVGGGTGTLVKSIAERFPDMNCICFDLPHVVVGLDGSRNLRYVGGDMFEGIPNADAVLLKWILHDWNDEECIKILKRCKEAIPSKDKGGKVIIMDLVVSNADQANDKELETQLKSDMLMMTLVTGRERNEKDWHKLFCDARFSDYKITRLPGLKSVIEVYP